ncbi:hypothetical protein [Candidatus Sulfurimonas baltica]|uniref:Uncharacterized protein n=1 Tax=Candidatus Sulfurimonas baltica TaxID=2740404 RepID=A0A7S7RNC7_9BACT|nr:hypothetical protein [Candidatus Sulfurimonas baltica]QOY52305.1 hypothetical protein HUE88_01015 [Candidatus Sulfurimonas baltica]
MSKILLDILSNATSSVDTTRSSIFLPYSNIQSTNTYKNFVSNGNKGSIFENREYKIKIRNRLLGQSHRDILDVIFSEKLLKRTTNNEHYAEFSLYFILKKLGKSQGGKNRDFLKEKIQDLVDVVISLERFYGSSNSWSDIHILDKAQYSSKNNKFIIKFSSDYINSFKTDTLVNYDKYLPAILAIRNDTIKSFVRYVLANDFINFQLVYVLEQLGINTKAIGTRQLNKIKKTIKDFDLSVFGITITDSEQVSYNKQNDINFWTVDTELKKAGVSQQVVSASAQANNTLLKNSYDQASGITIY